MGIVRIFFPLLLDIKSIVDMSDAIGIVFRMSGNGAVNIAWTDMDRNDVWALYRSDMVQAGESFSTSIDHAPVVNVGQNGFVVPAGVISRIRSGNDVIMACEARPCESNAVLQIDAMHGGFTVSRISVTFSASDVKDMYHWINLRHFSGQSEIDPTEIEIPSNADWSENLPHVFFVHGANVDEAASRVWCGRMFKRLYLSGAKMRFHGVSWQSKVGGDSEYHLNASNSFDVAEHLAGAVNACSGRKVVIAHSLGTMLTANAIQFFGMQVDKVIFLNSAIPSEALDPAMFDASVTNQLVHDAWVSYPSNCWTALYHTLDLNETDRSRLTWRNRFPLVATKLFNMYSSGDEVLSLYDGGGNPGWSDGLWSSSTIGARYSWQKQELWKGRAGFLSRIGTTSWSGWGFKSGFLGIRSWSSEDANAVTDRFVFATNTVFNPFPISITNSILSEAQISAHLTQGVPALSRALGSVRLSNDDGSCSIDV